LILQIESKVLCELCGKMYMDINFLKYHCFRRHAFNSCTYMNSPEDNRIESLKLEVLQLQNQLKKTKSNYQNDSQVNLNFKNNYFSVKLNSINIFYCFRPLIHM